MPKIPGLNAGTTYVKGMMGALTGKNAARAVASGAHTASGAAAHGVNLGIAKRTMNYAKSHPYKAGAMGAAGLGAVSYVTGRSRRGAGVSKTQGRPTGMYKY